MKRVLLFLFVVVALLFGFTWSAFGQATSPTPGSRLPPGSMAVPSGGGGGRPPETGRANVPANAPVQAPSRPQSDTVPKTKYNPQGDKDVQRGYDEHQKAHGK